MTRTDRNLISKANLDPAEVAVREAIDLNGPQPPRGQDVLSMPRELWDELMADFLEMRKAWEEHNLELFGQAFPGHRCNHCGASLRWGFVVEHLPTGTYFVVGETCATERMDLDSKAQHLMRLAKLSAENREREQNKRENLAAFAGAFPAEHAYLVDENRKYDAFLDELLTKLRRYGQLSPKQVACVTRSMERQAKWDAENAARQASLTEVLAEGRYELVGTVKSTKEYESDFGWQLKMLVELENGNRVYGTVPSSLGNVERGDKVRFTAKVERSKDDEHFGFYSRPTKAAHEEG